MPDGEPTLGPDHPRANEGTSYANALLAAFVTKDEKALDAVMRQLVKRG